MLIVLRNFPSLDSEVLFLYILWLHNYFWVNGSISNQNVIVWENLSTFTFFCHFCILFSGVQQKLWTLGKFPEPTTDQVHIEQTLMIQKAKFPSAKRRAPSAGKWKNFWFSLPKKQKCPAPGAQFWRASKLTGHRVFLYIIQFFSKYNPTKNSESIILWVWKLR